MDPMILARFMREHSNGRYSMDEMHVKLDLLYAQHCQAVTPVEVVVKTPEEVKKLSEPNPTFVGTIDDVPVATPYVITEVYSNLGRSAINTLKYAGYVCVASNTLPFTAPEQAEVSLCPASFPSLEAKSVCEDSIICELFDRGIDFGITRPEWGISSNYGPCVLARSVKLPTPFVLRSYMEDRKIPWSNRNMFRVFKSEDFRTHWRGIARSIERRPSERGKGSLVHVHSAKYLAQSALGHVAWADCVFPGNDTMRFLNGTSNVGDPPVEDFIVSGSGGDDHIIVEVPYPPKRECVDITVRYDAKGNRVGGTYYDEQGTFRHWDINDDICMQ